MKDIVIYLCVVLCIIFYVLELYFIYKDKFWKVFAMVILGLVCCFVVLTLTH